MRKGFEAYFTVLIEFMWSKQRIMEVYLNSIEMGPGIYGVWMPWQSIISTRRRRICFVANVP